MQGFHAMGNRHIIFLVKNKKKQKKQTCFCSYSKIGSPYEIRSWWVVLSRGGQGSLESLKFPYDAYRGSRYSTETTTTSTNETNIWKHGVHNE
jgi:hypothetical protein